MFIRSWGGYDTDDTESIKLVFRRTMGAWSYNYTQGGFRHFFRGRSAW